MFATQVDATHASARIVVWPNRSLSWRGNVAVIASLGLVMATIGSGFAWVGLWLVLPFAGLELMAVAAGLYVTCRRLANNEVICVSPQAVTVESGYRYPAVCRKLRRHWACIELRAGPSRTHPNRLFIRSQGHAIEVGVCLTDNERERLARELRRLLAA